MYRTIYVKNFEVTGCVVYDDAVPVRMDCKVCVNRERCIYKNVVFEDESE